MAQGEGIRLKRFSLRQAPYALRRIVPGNMAHSGFHEVALDRAPLLL